MHGEPPNKWSTIDSEMTIVQRMKDIGSSKILKTFSRSSHLDIMPKKNWLTQIIFDEVHKKLGKKNVKKWGHLFLPMDLFEGESSQLWLIINKNWKRCVILLKLLKEDQHLSNYSVYQGKLKGIKEKGRYIFTNFLFGSILWMER